jgi:hypothetical protein
MKTPETDANEYPASTFVGAGLEVTVVHSNLARKLEKERDEAREFAKYVNQASLEMEKNLFEARSNVKKLEEELDDALAELQSMTRKRDNALLSIATLGDQHERECAELKEERDAWKSEALIMDARLRGVKHPNDNGIVSPDEVIPKLESEIVALKETAERYRLAANLFEVEAMQLKDQLKECDEAISACLSNFSCRTFVPLNWELPPSK